MIEFHYKIHHFGNNFHEILCCDCFFDEVYFLLRKKEDNGEIFEEEFENYDECFITFYDRTIVVVCADIIQFVRDEKHQKLFKDICVRDVIWCQKNKIILCSICTVEIFKKLNILHLFKLK